jgi:hypothetical protein
LQLFQCAYPPVKTLAGHGAEFVKPYPVFERISSFCAISNASAAGKFSSTGFLTCFAQSFRELCPVEAVAFGNHAYRFPVFNYFP